MFIFYAVPTELKKGRITFNYKHSVPTGLKRVSGNEYSLSLHPPNTKRVFGVDLDECHTRIHIVDL